MFRWRRSRLAVRPGSAPYSKLRTVEDTCAVRRFRSAENELRRRLASGRSGTLPRARVCLSKLGEGYRIDRLQPARVCLSKLGEGYRIDRLQPARFCLCGVGIVLCL